MMSNLVRGFCLKFPKQNFSTKMKAFVLYTYNEIPELSDIKVPVIEDPNDILVRVHSTSINPIDLLMKDGYGKTLLYYARCASNFPSTFSSEFPLILGRDCSGTVLEVGKNVENFKPGDEVWGALELTKQGSNAEFALLSKDSLSIKPSSLTHNEAASIPYVAMTVYSAFKTFGMISTDVASNNGKHALVRGGSGGIGTFAIQLLNGWGYTVSTTCTQDAIPLMESLGAEFIYDYQSATHFEEINFNPDFDVILDSIGGKDQSAYASKLKKNAFSRYISLVSPICSDTDENGMLLGLAKSTSDYACKFLNCIKDSNIFVYAYFMPNVSALKEAAMSIESKQIRPVLDKVYPFSEIGSAYEVFACGHARGKSVIEIVPEKPISSASI